MQEELQRHYVWLDNKKYIEQHNMNEAEERGFTLAMNQFADLVSPLYILDFQHTITVSWTINLHDALVCCVILVGQSQYKTNCSLI